jgi:predicted DNA-binding protein
MNKVVSIRISFDDYEKLEEIARAFGISVSAYVRYKLFKKAEVKK